ncbi:MAG: hypothetical protein ACRC33_15990 [Gemmataceae bacterium]
MRTRERGEPPAHVRPLAASRRAEEAPEGEACCCAEKPAPPPSTRWVVGVFAAKCAGTGPMPSDAELAVPPAPAVAPAVPVAVGYLPALQAFPTVRHALPSSPPRRGLTLGPTMCFRRAAAATPAGPRPG